jgi:Ca2+/H+ antiporter
VYSQLQIGPYVIATSALVIEVLLIIVLLVGWVYGSRRLNFRLHHRAVYSIVLVNSLIVGLWMIPRAMNLAQLGFFNNLSTSWHQTLHDTLGIIAVVLSIIVSVIFLWRRDMPARLLKRTRPLMILILSLWIITFALGILAYTVFWS